MDGDIADDRQSLISENGAGGDAYSKNHDCQKTGKAWEQGSDGGAEAIHQDANKAHSQCSQDN